MTDAQQLARQLLARHGAPGPGASGVQSVRHSGLSDHPHIVRAREIRNRIDTELIPFGLPDPYFLPHTGVNGATLHVRGQDTINFSGYNYLGLAGDPRVIAAAKEAADAYGTSASASRAVGGEIGLYADLERRLATAYDVDGAVVTPSGYLTNAGIIPFLLGPNDLAVCDSLVHSSITAGTQWAQCRRANFRHNDPGALEALLRRRRSQSDRAMVILEGVYSMDGDIVRLPEMIEIARRYDCLVMVDEAHSFGTLGARGLGVREYFDLPGSGVDIWMGTLSKTLASCGGFLAGDAELMFAIKLLAPGLCMFVAPPTPPQIAAAIAAFDIMLAEPERLTRLRGNASSALAAARAAGWHTGTSQDTPIIPIVLGDTERAVTASIGLLLAGINASAITYPNIAEGEARLRLFMSADHTPEHLARMLAALAEVASP